jgi:DNA invertase Pin-like site-specific DNA recombinase
MIAAARDGRFDVLLVKNIRRLGDTADSRRLFNQLYDLGIEICSPLEGKMGGTHHV